MWKIYKPLLVLLLLQAAQKHTAAKPTVPQYNNATLQLSRGIQMSAYMNGNANPCDNFYNWACGRWAFNHPASTGRNKTSFVGLLEDLYVSKCAAALQEPNSESSNNNGATATDTYLNNLLKAVFDSCRDTQTIKTVGYAPIWDALNFQLGWPLITDNDWFEDEYDWLKLVVLAKRKFNVDVFIAFDVVTDLQHADKSRIQLGAPALELEKHTNYARYVQNKLQQFFPEMSNAWAQELASQVQQVEEQLGKALQNVTQETTPLERYVAELKASYGSFVDLSRYLQLMFDRPINEKIYEMPKGYFKNLVDIIRLTPKLTLANYTLWKVLDRFDLGGSKEFCVHKLIDFFPHEMEYFYNRNYEDTELFQELQTMFHTIKYNLNSELQTSPRFSWISPKTLQNLREKLRAMRIEVLQPQEHIGFFQGGIKPANMYPDQYYNNIINLLEWQNEKQLLKLHQAAALLHVPQNSPSYTLKLLPTYNTQTNIIQFPVVFLQPRFFWDTSYPTSIKYGTFGFVLAQQIVRGLSENDSEAGQQKVWDIASELTFVKRSSCFADQPYYSAKEFKGKSVNDRERLKKAFIDNGGLSLAYRLYEKWTQGKSEQDISVLPRLPNKHRQQFFLAYAQLFCADYADEVLQFVDLPEALRLNGAVANLNEFGNAFECGVEHTIKDKCVIF
ncbi:phosphate-regulating neutral endopeptidase PHEX-like [Bactrocera tryoni]|uniref:phosphate-regulating neutral endopeptidase PHEX-like n=1 Tax=Bactrocera tryoni TaxID=59916 RepID=UPI001A95994C|nr:phosphate-regulating neutral endopeptidase PHEX-like [Bactrocera tryoni]